MPRRLLSYASATPPAASKPLRPSSSHLTEPVARGHRPILVADDEADVVDLLAKHLSAAGHRVIKAVTGTDALALAHAHRPAVAVLDIVMAGMTGIEVCRALKSDTRTNGVAVIILSARTSEVDRILSFELGADDFIGKPFSPRELVLRVGAILRRGGGPPETASFVSAGAIDVDFERHTVRVAGEPVALTVIEFKLLYLLMVNKGRTLSRATILDTVWGVSSDVEQRTVDTHLRRLRDKLGNAASQLQTVRGFGYRLDEG